MIVAALLLAATVPPATSGTSADAEVEKLENQKEWTEADRQRAVELARLKAASWRTCLSIFEDQFRRSKEPVDIVVTAIFGGCLPVERGYQRAYAVAFRGLADPTQRAERARQGIESARVSAREEIISRLVSERLPPAR